MSDLPRWMQPPSQPAAGTTAAPADGSATPGERVAPTAPIAPALKVSGASSMEKVVSADAVQAADAQAGTEAEQLAAETAAAPAKASEYRLGSVLGGAEMPGAVRVIAERAFFSLGLPVGVAQACVVAGSKLSAESPSEQVLQAGSSKCMNELTQSVLGAANGDREAARAEALRIVRVVDDWVTSEVARKQPGLAKAWLDTEISNNPLLIRKLYNWLQVRKH
jgi:hypothetical protein